MSELKKENPNQLDPYISDTEICKALGKSKPTLWRWRQQGDFPHAHRIGPNSNGTPLSIFKKWQEDKARQVGVNSNA